MVPYVRKSFYKHWKDGMKYIEKVDPCCDTADAVNLSICSNGYLEFQQAYQYAMDMTEKELKQAVEAMYHNLNTL